MSKSAIYVVNNTAQEVIDGGSINPGTIIRRFGQNLSVVGTAIQLDGSGYYSLDSTITLSPTEIGEITVTAYANGVAIPGSVATVTVTAANDIITLPIVGLIREVNCCYYNGPLSLTFVVSGGDVSVPNIATKVIKL